MSYSKKRNLISKILTKWGNSSPYFVYIFQNGGTRHYKIGITKDLLARYTQAKTFVSGGLEIIKVFPCDFISFAIVVIIILPFDVHFQMQKEAVHIF